MKQTLLKAILLVIVNTICKTNCFDQKSNAVAAARFRGSRPLNSKDVLHNDEGTVRKLQATGLSFALYNADTDLKVYDLVNGTVIALNQINLTNPKILNIEVTVTGGTSFAGSMLFALNINQINRTDNGSRYAMCGGSGSNFYRCNNLTVGNQDLRVTLFSQKAGGGVILGTVRLNFQIVLIGVSPVPAPVPASVPASVPAPVPAPVSTPVPAPVPAPAPVPVPAPVPAPVPVSTKSPVALQGSSCPIPKLVGTWEKWQDYPIALAESLGGMIGDDYVVVSGYNKSWYNVTKAVFALKTTNASAIWRAMDDVPVPVGFSHAAFGVTGNLMYICGGYLGATPGPHTNVCLRYNHTAPPTQQFSFLPPLPEGRGGGAMFYIQEFNSLVYTTGATRPDGNPTDHNTTWELDLNNLTGGWALRQPLPYKGNHVSHVAASYNGTRRYFVLGGQIKSNEANGNLADNFEWDAMKRVWMRRASMLFPRGHASSSTVGYGCGFLIMGGAINGYNKTTDISYYGIDTDTWTKVGHLQIDVNTPTCDIVRFGSGNDWIYCTTGPISSKWSYRIRITL